MGANANQGILQVTGISGTAKAVRDTSTPCTRVLLQAENGNAGVLTVGFSASTCYLEVPKRTEGGLVLPVHDLAGLYVKTSSGSSDKLNVYYIAGPIA